MQIHGPGQIHGAQPINAPHGVKHAPPAGASPTSDRGAVDELDISREADLVSRVRELPDVRADKVASIRAQIEAGTYDSDEKLEIAVSRLFDELA